MQRAIEKTEGPCIILAGAGTGKTYTIVEKIKYLIEKKIYPSERIVCITFSNEAANNLLSRVRRALEFGKGREPIIRTFHGFSSDLLRKYGEKIGIGENFKVLDPDQAKVILHSNFRVSPYYCHKYISEIGTAKDLGVGIEDLEEYLERREKDFSGINLERRLESLQFELQTLHLKAGKGERSEIMSKIKEISFVLNLRKFVQAWKGYEKLKVKKNFQDYSDLNMNALKLLRENPEIAEGYDYVVVDEFQDTNKLQIDLLKYLAVKRNITVVGDLNQSIYRFRGAYKENFSEFKKFFNVGSGDIFNLDKSYRSSNKILRVAHNLILNNYENPEDCFEVKNYDNREGDKIDVYELKNAKEEARKVVELVESEIERGVEPEEICILFRAHQQGRIIKNLLDVKKIDYSSVTKESLLKRREVGKVIDYLAILNCLKRKKNGSEQAWWDLIYKMDYIDSDLIKIGRFIKENKDCDCLSVKLLNELEKMNLSTSGRLASKILIERIKLLIPFCGKEVPELIKEVYRVGGLINREKTKDDKEVMLNLNKFYELAREHSGLYAPDLDGFIHYLDILESLELEVSASGFEKPGVKLMTSHATKGLEYKTVIITNLAQRRFPIVRFTNNSFIPMELHPELGKLDFSDGYVIEEYENKHQLYEERRLCYVGLTRAKQKLILTYAKEYGGKKYWNSQFLDEINFKQNKDINLVLDNDEKYEEPVLDIQTAFDLRKALSSPNSEDIIIDMIKSSDRKSANLDNGLDIVFSPSALLLFNKCQKEYEYKYRYNMPEKKAVSWEAIRLGSFVHQVLEKGVKGGFKSLKEFLDLGREMNCKEDWESVNFDDAEHLVKVFYERNKNKISDRSKTEQKLDIELGDLKFTGFADRIDFRENGLEIIDYKTGKSSVSPLERNWQMGYYALAASKLGKVKKITLDLLNKDKPLEFEIDDEGNALSVNSARMEGFNIYEVESELVDTAHKIQNAFKNGFKPCEVEKNCPFCNEYVYGL